MNATALSAAWNQYGAAFRIHAHQLLLWGYQDTRTHADEALRIHANQEETDITGLIADAMKERLDHPHTPVEYERYAVGDQVPVRRKQGELGKSRGRLDLSVIRTGGKPQIAYVFEAKRLQTSHHSIGDYVGPEGMGDYVQCRYARNYPEAAMIGIFHNRDLAYWHKELRRSFADDEAGTESRLGILSHPCSIEVLPDLPGELESTHRRTDQTPIRILHIFLECI